LASSSSVRYSARFLHTVSSNPCFQQCPPTDEAADIFETLIVGSKTSKKAVRRPSDNGPIANLSSNDIRCNVNLQTATETAEVAAGDRIGFELDGVKTIYHLGPASMYLGRAPSTAAAWDGSGKSWFKVCLSGRYGTLWIDKSAQIAQWGAAFRPKFTFVSLNQRVFVTTIPKSVPSGEVCSSSPLFILEILG
jgi:hypothetical protein